MIDRHINKPYLRIMNKNKDVSQLIRSEVLKVKKNTNLLHNIKGTGHI